MNRSRIWDLHRGDDEDNRFSPVGGGLRGLILPTLLEFNYLKAPFSFVTLVLGPAILVGIAPSVVVTYGQFVFHAAALSRSRVVIGVLCVITLLLVAMWTGQRFLKAAFVRARYLHYALILPIFVAVREVLRTIGEHFGGQSLSPEQLSHRRRVATILAALLFCFAGIALIVRVEVSFGLKLVNVERVSPWATLRAAIGNAAVVLGASTVFESLYWLRRELTLKSPVLDWVSSGKNNNSSALRVAHLSDLHLVGERYGFRMETGMNGPRGNRRFRNALRKIAAIDAETPLDRILVTGDVTDAGTRAEWTAFIDLLREHEGLRKRLSFVPGNHDVNIVDRRNPGRLDLPWSSGPALRKLRLILTLDAIQGERAFVVDRLSFKLGPTLRDYIREGDRTEVLRNLAKCGGGLRGRAEIAKIWDGMFPLVELPSTDQGCGLILLDSNAPSHFSLTNAIGLVSPMQIKALNAILRDSAGHAWIIVLHHQVVEYPVTSIPLRDRVGLALVNATDLLATIVPYASRVLVLHGHRHRDWIGTCGEVVLCSAPSVTMGCEGGDEGPGVFHIHELAIETKGRIHLANTQRIRVA
jgi:predicted MPP superfamily phosphohydrolase